MLSPITGTSGRKKSLLKSSWRRSENGAATCDLTRSHDHNFSDGLCHRNWRKRLTYVASGMPRADVLHERGVGRRKRLPHEGHEADNQIVGQGQRTDTREEMQMQRAFGAFAGRRPTLQFCAKGGALNNCAFNVVMN